MLRFQCGRDRRDLPCAEHHDFGLNLRHGVGFFPDSFLVVFLGNNSLNQFLLRGAESLIQPANFLAVRLHGFAQQFSLLFVEAPAPKICTSAALKICVLISSARSSIAAIAAPSRIRVRIRAVWLCGCRGLCKRNGCIKNHTRDECGAQADGSRNRFTHNISPAPSFICLVSKTKGNDRGYIDVT